MCQGVGVILLRLGLARVAVVFDVGRRSWEMSTGGGVFHAVEVVTSLGLFCHAACFGSCVGLKAGQFTTTSVDEPV